MSRTLPSITGLAAAFVFIASASAADVPPDGKAFLAFIRQQAIDLRAADKPPTTKEEWLKQKEEIRKQLLASWGGFPSESCPLEPKNYGTLVREGYRVEKITFQTRPGVRMTANLYLPDKPGKLPAILQVHGHWKGAKQDPVVQARCIGAAKAGFVVLCVDAFGAGERGINTALGEYHGEMTAATLLPAGMPLAGLQVYENMRAVDYLQSREEVDKDHIGITGASGGGNQTMYAGAWDERIKCVVPVCSVGNYQAYLGTACCMCEVVPGALRHTEEANLLALVAPRGLMVVNATRDAVQFSVAEAKKSIGAAEPVFKLFDKPGHIKHAIFESAHDYNKDMREAMYGWMSLHLKGEGDGSPIKEGAFKTENPEDLRCYPGDTRPKDFMTIPMFAAAEGRKLLAARKPPASTDEWKEESAARRTALTEKVFGGFPKYAPQRRAALPLDSTGQQQLATEPGIDLIVSARTGKTPQPAGPPTIAIILSLDGDAAERGLELRKAAMATDWIIYSFDLRATGKLANPGDKIGRAPDHNTAQWGLWIGRPLLGQWVFDVRQVIDALPEAREVIVIGEGPAGLVALCAAATNPRINKAAAVGTMTSFITDVPYEGQRLGVIAPGILREVGDVAHLAALAAPKRIVIAGGVTGGGKALTGDELREAYRPATRVWGLLEAPEKMIIQEKADAAAVIAALK
jgi:dienelactone hydrolase